MLNWDEKALLNIQLFSDKPTNWSLLAYVWCKTDRTSWKGSQLYRCTYLAKFHWPYVKMVLPSLGIGSHPFLTPAICNINDTVPFLIEENIWLKKIKDFYPSTVRLIKDTMVLDREALETPYPCDQRCQPNSPVQIFFSILPDNLKYKIRIRKKKENFWFFLIKESFRNGSLKIRLFGDSVMRNNWSTDTILVTGSHKRIFSS